MVRAHETAHGSRCRTLDCQSEEASTHGVLDADKSSLYRSAVPRMNYWAVDRPDRQFAVRVCPKSMSSPRVNDWRRLKRVARYVEGSMSTGAAELAHQAMGTENMAREWRVHLDSMELQVDANAAIGIIGRQGSGKSRHLDLSYLWLQSAVRGNQVNLKKVKSENNMADLETKVLEKDRIDRHMKNLGCVRFDR